MRPLETLKMTDGGEKEKNTELKGICAEIYNTDFFHTFVSVSELPISEKQKTRGLTNFVFEIKRMKNYHNFDKSIFVTAWPQWLLFEKY